MLSLQSCSDNIGRRRVDLAGERKSHTDPWQSPGRGRDDRPLPGLRNAILLAPSHQCEPVRIGCNNVLIEAVPSWDLWQPTRARCQRRRAWCSRACLNGLQVIRIYTKRHTPKVMKNY